MPDQTDRAFPIEHVRAVGDDVVAAVSTVVDGKVDAIRTAFTVMLAEGHLLVEDVPAWARPCSRRRSVPRSAGR